MMPDDDKTTSPIKENVKGIFDETAGFSTAILEMLKGTEELNKAFGQTRTRATEMMKAVSDTALQIVRLGGDINDTIKTMSEISAATGKNVIANADAAGKLYATSEVLGTSVESLVSNFADVGFQFSQISKEMEDATKYVRDMGLNTKQVMEGVLNNFDKLNKYNFEGGVQGMTKMAAKATMFRIDMRETFSLAEKVMKPENAVATASAFQRLGVAAGNMVDPFALMNASINDPGALQDTIVNIGKQFTYFDEKTKSFRINPQGMLTLRELEAETGLSYEQLSKAGLAASELDARLSQISPAIKFENETDKQFLTNIAQLGDGGKYEVTLEDGTKKDISKLNQEEFDRLIKVQKDAPKDMEDVARAQLGTQKLIASDVKAMFESTTRGVASSSLVRENIEGLRNVSKDFLGTIAKGLVKTNVVGDNIEKVTQAVRGSIQKMISSGGKTDIGEIMKSLGTEFKGSTKEVATVVQQLSKQAFETIKKRGGSAKASEIEMLASTSVGYFEELLDAFKGKEKGTGTTAVATTGKATSSSESGLSGGLSTSEKIDQVKYGNKTLTSQVSQSVDFGGTITIKVDAPAGVSSQYLQEFINSEEFKRNIYVYIQKQMQASGQTQKTIPGP